MHFFQFPERDHTNRAMGKADSDCVALEQRPLGLLESLCFEAVNKPTYSVW